MSPIPDPCELNFFVEDAEPVIQEVFADRVARTIWLGIKAGHIVSQEFNQNCLTPGLLDRAGGWDRDSFLVDRVPPEARDDRCPGEVREHPGALCQRRQGDQLDRGTGVSAIFSPDRMYRYELEREVNALGDGMVAFGMLNGSKANEKDNDPTVTRTIGFARHWGFRWLRVVNLFALVATDPKDLYSHPDPVGWENNHFLTKAMVDCQQFIAAWGVHGALYGRGAEVLQRLVRIAPMRVYHLGLTKDGHPRHPLYLPKVSARQRFP